MKLPRPRHPFGRGFFIGLISQQRPPERFSPAWNLLPRHSTNQASQEILGPGFGAPGILIRSLPSNRSGPRIACGSGTFSDFVIKYS
jgi:hypothetical protein